MMKKSLLAVLAGALLLGALPAAAQSEIDNVCLVTDIGRVNDGTFNQYAFAG